MEYPFYNLIIILAFAMLLIAFALAFARIVKGPTVRDRIVAMDLVASITMGFILVYSVVINKAMYFDIVIVISLISFIGTVAISTFLKQN
ncbi:multisubunit sodium/proton antiporter, MrpF subunit [Saccharicrinis carchari]|uniref:Multisubunit sodium/proton antiporter, MrpF subunit n=2 Tax=Saccharicrinis carchari TaxID=1168039 RepID=A0A521AZ56_SACCC|nr:multisubunit sodium/proton antiporter, MrpF subunit [Saccharicrinis carchari]